MDGHQKAQRWLHRLWSKYHGQPLTKEDFTAIVGDWQRVNAEFAGTPDAKFVELKSWDVLHALEEEAHHISEQTFSL